MAIPLSIVLTLLTAHYFYYQQKSLTFLQNSVLFMILNLLTMNLYTITAFNLNWIKITQDSILFTVIPLTRNIVIPLMVLIFINAFLSRQKVSRKMLILLLFLVYSLGMDVFLVTFKVLDYGKWKLSFSMIVNSGYFLLTLLLVKLIRIKEPRHDNRL